MQFQLKFIEVAEADNRSEYFDVTYYWCGVGGILIRPWTGQSGVLLPIGARNLYLLQNFQSHTGAHPSFYSVGTGGFFPRG